MRMLGTLAKNVFTGVALVAGIGACNGAAAQDQTKTIRAPEYTKKRPSVAEGGQAVPTTVRVRVRPRKTVIAVNTKPIPRKQIETARLGVTVWRVDASNNNQTKSLTEQDARSSDGHRLARLSADAVLAVGDSVKIGVESLTHPGYLYIIDREKYADGTFGQPILIYPTLRYSGGNNFIRPGDIVFLPSPNRELVVKTDTSTRQVAEELTIVVSPTRLIEPLQLQSTEIKLSPSQLLGWFQKWSRRGIQYDQVDSPGSSMSLREQAAGGDQSKGLHEQPLTKDDPLPQTIIEMMIKKNDPIITTVTLPIKQA